jgi:hypothetical protein
MLYRASWQVSAELDVPSNVTPPPPLLARTVNLELTAIAYNVKRAPTVLMPVAP